MPQYLYPRARKGEGVDKEDDDEEEEGEEERRGMKE